jgi:Domain of unknown function (DUF4268)
MAYWQSFADFLRKQNSAFAIRRPVKNRLYRFPMDVPGYRIVASISIQNQLATVGLSISRDPERLKYQALFTQKAAIEAEFGEPMAWDEKPGTRRSLISITRGAVNPADDSQYQDLHAWMSEKMAQFRSVFTARIVAMPIPQSGSESEDDDE